MRAFITLEGIDGSGTTTHTELLAEYLGPLGFKVIKTREPGGTPVGDKIRELLHSPQEKSPLTELCLFEAARSELVRRIIRPALEEGCVVISDRYVDSSLAYQGYGRGLDRRLIRRYNQDATGGLEPDLTLLYDVDVEEIAKHLFDNDYFERMGSEFFKRVREGYLELAKEDPERFVVIPRAGGKTARESIIGTFEEGTLLYVNELLDI